MTLFTRAAAAALSLVAIMAVDKPFLVKGQSNGVAVTATINILYDPNTRLIYFDQKGSVTLPEGASLANDSTPGSGYPLFRLFNNRRALGLIQERDFAFFFVDRTLTNFDGSCLKINTLRDTSITDAIPTLFVNERAADGVNLRFSMWIEPSPISMGVV